MQLLENPRPGSVMSERTLASPSRTTWMAGDIGSRVMPAWTRSMSVTITCNPKTDISDNTVIVLNNDVNGKFCKHWQGLATVLHIKSPYWLIWMMIVLFHVLYYLV